MILVQGKNVKYLISLHEIVFTVQLGPWSIQINLHFIATEILQMFPVLHKNKKILSASFEGPIMGFNGYQTLQVGDGYGYVKSHCWGRQLPILLEEARFVSSLKESASSRVKLAWKGVGVNMRSVLHCTAGFVYIHQPCSPRYFAHCSIHSHKHEPYLESEVSGAGGGQGAGKEQSWRERERGRK